MILWKSFCACSLFSVHCAKKGTFYNSIKNASALFSFLSSKPLPFSHFLVVLSHSMSIFGMFSSSSHPCFSLQVIMRPIFRVLINPKWLSQCNKLGCVIMTCSDVVSFIHPSPPIFSVFASASSKFMFIIISVFRCFQTRAERRQRGTITPRSVPPFQKSSPFWHSRREWIGWRETRPTKHCLKANRV